MCMLQKYCLGSQLGKGSKVVRTHVLGIFSFLQYVEYEDFYTYKSFTIIIIVNFSCRMDWPFLFLFWLFLLKIGKCRLFSLCKYLV